MKLVTFDAGQTRDRVGYVDGDTVVYAARNRLYVSENGGLFWRALAVELPAIQASAI